MISVKALANTILKKSFEESIIVTPMKLQKLIYFIYRDYYKKYHKKLFSECFLTWQYGPVLSSIYDEFKCFGANRITQFTKDANGNVFIVPENDNFSITNTINDVWNSYKHFDGIRLSEKTHLDNTAWTKAYEKGSPYLCDEDIKDENEC